MHFGKVIISLLLLLTYSFGFAHTLIPHQEKNDVSINITFQENEHHHPHHEHRTDENTGKDHKHIQHENHFDESLYDLIACFLCELEYPSNNCEVQHYIPEKTREDANRNFTKAKLTKLLLAIVIGAGQIDPKSEYDEKSNNNYLEPPLNYAPHRGPPSLT